jgi:predicted deacylase
MSEVVARSSAGIDLHSAAIHRENLPQIRIDAGSERVRRLARRFSPPVILQTKLREGSMRMAAREKGIDVLVYEAGEALRFDETAIRLGVRGILRVLHEMEMIPSDRGLKPVVSPVLSTRSDWVRAPMGGVLRAYTTCGKVVEKGDLIAAVGDPLGDREQEVRAEFPGLVVGRTHLPIVNEGDALFHIAEIARGDQAHGAMEKLGEGFEGDPLFDEDEIL